MMYSEAPNFALIGDNDALWVPILQKAWAKVKGTYVDANLGFTASGFRALTGAPVFDYYT